MEDLGPNVDLSIEMITKKLAMLLAVLSGVRGQSISLLDSVNMTLDKGKRVSFRIADKIKTSRPGKHADELVFIAFPHDPNICVVNTLEHYLDKTAIRRKGIDALFVTHGKPHGAAARSTITRWLREIMTNAGIDMNIFKAHSVRTASVSSVVSRLPLATILKTGGWTRETTFTKFYKKPVIHEGAMQEAIMKGRKAKN